MEEKSLEMSEKIFFFTPPLVAEVIGFSLVATTAAWPDPATTSLVSPSVLTGLPLPRLSLIFNAFTTDAAEQYQSGDGWKSREKQLEGESKGQ